MNCFPLRACSSSSTITVVVASIYFGPLRNLQSSQHSHTAFAMSQSFPRHSQSVPKYHRTAFGLSQSSPGQSQSIPECRRTAFGLSQSLPARSQRPGMLSYSIIPKASRNVVVQHSNSLLASQGIPERPTCVVQHSGLSQSFPLHSRAWCIPRASQNAVVQHSCCL